jgi:hypothetical protein
VAVTNLNQRRMHNPTMSRGRVLLDTVKHFLNYKKIITTRIHARGNDDVDNKARDKMTRKMGAGQTEQPLILEHPGYNPRLKSLQYYQVRGHGD